MTPNTMRSQLAGFVKLDMGRVRRRTSRKAPNWDVGLHRKGIKCTLPVDRKIKMKSRVMPSARKWRALSRILNSHCATHDFVGEICGRESYASWKKRTKNCGFS